MRLLQWHEVNYICQNQSGRQVLENTVVDLYSEEAAYPFDIIVRYDQGSDFMISPSEINDWQIKYKL